MFYGLKSAETAIERLCNFKRRLETDRFPEGSSETLIARTALACKAFTDGMNADLNTAEALGALFEYVRDANSAMDSGEFRAGNVPGGLELLALFDRIFAVLEPTAAAGFLPDDQVEARIAE